MLTNSMHMSWDIYMNLGLLSLNVLANASALPRGDKHSSPDRSHSPMILPQQPSLHGIHEIHPFLASMSADKIIKRDDEQDDDLWIRRVEILTLNVPIAAVRTFRSQSALFGTVTELQNTIRELEDVLLQRSV